MSTNQIQPRVAKEKSRVPLTFNQNPVKTTLARPYPGPRLLIIRDLFTRFAQNFSIKDRIYIKYLLLLDSFYIFILRLIDNSLINVHKLNRRM